MDTTVTAVVLLAALMHAVWNALLNSSADRLVELAALNLAAGLVGLAAVPFVGFPAKESFPFLLASLLLHVGYYAFLVLSYARGGLSLVYPIARGGSPVLLALVSALFLGEVLNGVETLGVVIITASIAGLALAGDVAGLSSNAVLFSLGTSVTIAGYTIADGSGARVSGAPIAYIAWLFVINAFPLLFVLPVLRPGLGLRALGRQWKTGLLGGVLSVGAYGLAIWAMTRAPIALVSALRETSVVLAAILGATFLREPFGPRRVLAAIGVALGIIVLRLAG